MAKSHHFIQLVDSYRNSNDRAFWDTVKAVRADAYAKNQVQFVAKLTSRIMVDEQSRGVARELPSEIKGFVYKEAPSDEKYVWDPRILGPVQMLELEIHHCEELKAKGLKPTDTILFYGPPGTGKTLGAKKLACRLGMNFYSVQTDQLIDCYLGGSAKNIKKLFDAIRSFPGLWFFDEFETLGMSRSFGSGVSHERNAILTSLLRFFDKGVGESVVVCATNLKEELDTAILRRFDSSIEFQNTTVENCEAIYDSLRSISEGKRVLGDVRREFCDLAAGMSHSAVSAVIKHALKREIIHKDSFEKILQSWVERMKEEN